MTKTKTPQFVRIIRGNFRGFQAQILSETQDGANLHLTADGAGFILNVPMSWYVRVYA